jgi:hypothetical protein
LLKHKKLVCYMGALHGFLDLRGLLAEDKGREFLDLRQYAIGVFVKHCAETFDEATVVSVVADAEEELFKVHLALTEAAKKNQLENRELVSKFNITHVLVLLQEPTANMLIRAADDGLRPQMVCGFEIVGPHHLPPTEPAAHLNSCSRGISMPLYRDHWIQMLNQVFQIAVRLLNEKFNVDVSHVGPLANSLPSAEVQ